MTLELILLVGAGGHARSCIDVIEQEGCFAVFGLTGLAEEVDTKTLGYSVLGTDADLPHLLHNCRNALVSVGQIKTPELRIHLFELLVRLGYRLPIIVSPRAYVSRHAVIGEGTIIMHGAVVNAGALVGRNCILNSLSLVEHDAVIADHCHISTMAAVNSGTQVGTGTFIGSGSSVRQCIKIGERSLIGMGQRVLADCLPGSQIPPLREIQ